MITGALRKSWSDTYLKLNIAESQIFDVSIYRACVKSASFKFHQRRGNGAPPVSAL